MSKKNGKSNGADSYTPHAVSSHATEYQIIKHDLIRVVLLNAVYLAAVLALYFTNAKNGYLEQWFAKISHF